MRDEFIEKIREKGRIPPDKVYEIFDVESLTMPERIVLHMKIKYGLPDKRSYGIDRLVRHMTGKADQMLYDTVFAIECGTYHLYTGSEEDE